YTVEVDPEVHNRGGDLRPDAANDAFGAHQPGGSDGLEQVLRDQRIDRGNTGDIDDGDCGACFHDGLQQALHHDLGALAIQRSDERQGENTVPEFDDGRRQFEELPLLAADYLLAAFLIGLGAQQAELVQKHCDLPKLVTEIAVWRRLEGPE